MAGEDARDPTEGREDRDLVRRALSGSEAAFAALVKSYERPVYNLALGIVRDADEAQDVAQETFLKAFGALHRYDPAHLFRVWLFRIAHNTAIDHIRRRRPGTISLDAAREGDEDTSSWEPADLVTPGPEERTVSRDRARVLDEALASLPPALRSAVVLRHVEDLSYEEIAQALGVPLGTVKIRIHRGREALAKILRRDLGPEDSV